VLVATSILHVLTIASWTATTMTQYTSRIKE
jgi:hypothetical protein